MTEQQGEQIIELLKQLNSRLSDISESVEVIKGEVVNIYLRTIKIENKL